LWKDQRKTEFVLKGILVLIVCVGFIISVFVVYYDLDPLYTPLKYLVGKSTSNLLLIQLLRFVWVILAVIELTKATIGGIFLPVFNFLMIIRSLNMLSNPMFRSNKKRLLCSTRLLHQKYLSDIVHINRIQAIFFNILQSNFYYFHIPVLLSSGISLGVICNVGTIRLVNIVKMPLYLAMPFTSVTVLICLVFIVSIASSVNGRAVEFLKFLRKNKTSPYEMKLVNSIRPIGLLNGPFFTMEMTTTAKTLNLVPNLTVSVLVALN